MPVFLLAIAVILTLTHVYFWRRFVRNPDWLPRHRGATKLALAALAVLALAGLSLSRWLGADRARPFTWVGGVWTGITFLLLMLLLAVDVIRGVGWLARRAARRPPFSADRRRLLARAVAGGVGVAATGLAGAALASEARGPHVVRVEVPLPRLPRALDGIRIVQLSDLHVGPVHGRAFVTDVVARANALEPDLVAITGDLADGSVDDVGPDIAPLLGLRSRHGVFFVTGNHEYFWGVEATLARLRELGVRVLRNERVTLTMNGGAIDVAGVDDTSAARFAQGHGPDADAALSGRDRSRPAVLLAHQPRQVFDAQRHDVDLVLSGHTHGGQVFPFGLFVRLVQPAVRGLHRFERTWLYVSCGTGIWGPPMRLGAPGEITLLVLRSAAAP